jgi:hypothetical protein
MIGYLSGEAKSHQTLCDLIIWLRLTGQQDDLRHQERIFLRVNKGPRQGL